MPHTIEILERSGEAETTWSAICLECGWISEDTRSRTRVERLAEDHRTGARVQGRALGVGLDHRHPRGRKR
jgi:hypothetical protein